MADLVPIITAAAVLDLVANSVQSEHTKRAYRKALIEFHDWFQAKGGRAFDRAAVQEYRSMLLQRGLSASTVNLKICAVRKLASELAANAWLPQDVASAISSVAGTRQTGDRIGKWLSAAQAEALLASPDRSTTKGKRDRALLALLIGTGLRRSEAGRLTFGHIQEREGRWVIADLVGKQGRVRTVPMPAWAKWAVDEWASAAGLTAGLVLRPLNKAGCVAGEKLSPQLIFELVRGYGDQCGMAVAPHDLRRTFARLARKGHAALEQIQLSLGHASLTTTERYLGVRLELHDAPCDHLGLQFAATDEPASPDAGGRHETSAGESAIDAAAG